MASASKFNPFIENLAEKKIDLGADQLVVGLTTNGNTPTSSMSQLSEITPIAYTNLSTRNLTTGTSAQSGGTYKLTITDLVLSASGGAAAAFRKIFIYSDTSTNDLLILFYDYGSDLTLADGESLTLDFDGTNGLLQAA